MLILGVQLQDVDPRVVQMYRGVKQVLTTYRSGKLPKAFKLIPKLRNWEQILYITGLLNFDKQLLFLLIYTLYMYRAFYMECSGNVPGYSYICI